MRSRFRSTPCAARLRLAASDISSAASGASILFEDKAIPFMPLSTALDGTRVVGAAGTGPRSSWPAPTASRPSASTACSAPGAIVVRPLPERLPQVRSSPARRSTPKAIRSWCSIPTAWSRPPSAATPASRMRRRRKRPVLVVDDSLTTRMLEQSILESAGYEVDVALSGEEALDCVRAQALRALPRRRRDAGHGRLHLRRALRADPALREIPAILVTSRAAPEDRQRGRDVGAQGYIVKSEFDQAELLTMIEPLMG